MVDDAVRYSEEKHVLLIHSAGNDGENNDTSYYYPVAVYENGDTARNFITVGWSRSKFNERLAHPHSNYGARSVDLFAPGSDIFSTMPFDNYEFRSASSMSTAIVTGVAALLYSYYPSLSVTQVKSILMQSVFKPDIEVNRPGSKIKVGFRSLSVSGGIVNAYNAVRMAEDMMNKR